MTKNLKILPARLFTFADEGLLNMAGGCCGTTPDHIHAISEKLREALPEKYPKLTRTSLEWLEPFTIKGSIEISYYGWRTNQCYGIATIS